jgi:arylsulfatase A-like enzyme
MPTFANLAGYKVPEDRRIDGVDQTDLILGKSEKGARDSFFYVNAMRKGNWKYLKAKHCMYGYSRDRKRAEVEELYDLEADLGETTNMAEKHPEKLAELKALLEAVKKGTDPGVVKVLQTVR